MTAREREIAAGKEAAEVINQARSVTLIDRQIFWISVMRDENQPIHARLKASELLGESQGDFKNRQGEP
jgi:hypothetical protein